MTDSESSKYEYRGKCISKALKAKYAKNPKPKYSETRKCLNCYTPFTVYRRDAKKKFCCFDCFNEYSKKYKIRSGGGGKRDKAGRSTCGIFKNIYFDNTDQLAFFVYTIYQGIRLYKNRKGFRYKSKSGFNKVFRPDFYDEYSMYYEVSDIKPNSRKLKAVLAGGYNIIVIDSEKVEPMIQWCLNKFKINHISELYEKKNTGFEYRCSWCGCTFKTKYERKSQQVFCSQEHSGFYHIKEMEYNGMAYRFIEQPKRIKK